MSRRRFLLGGAYGALALLLVVVAAAGWGYAELHRPYAGWDGDSVEIRLEPGLGAGSMLRRLEQAGVLRHARLARAWVGWQGISDQLQAGEYRFDRPISPTTVVHRLRVGDVLLHTVTIPEGLRLNEIADRIAETGLAGAEQMRAAFADPGLIRDLDPRADDLEGYLFPDTYRFPQDERPERIAEAMVRRFREVAGEDYAERAARSGLDLRQAVTLASMIEKETSVHGERARISRVFHNRLGRGMKLECDPTVIYALQRAGDPVDRLSRDDLKFESPWNTYVVAGLPVGPIANPGLASLEASLEPVEGEDLFFVASPDGGHRFSRTHAEHLDAVREWRRYVRSSR